LTKSPPKKKLTTTKPITAPIKGDKISAKPAAKKTQTKIKPTAPKKRKVDSDAENSDSEDFSIPEQSVLSNTPPSNKKLKKDTQPKKSSGKPLQEIDNESFTTGDMVPTKTSGKASNGNSDKYQKLTQLEHILKRPDTYIGSVERTEQQMWVFNSVTESMEQREVSFVPGLYKIFDEILVNAADNKSRDKNMDEIRVWIDREKGEIAVKNNGRGIPIEIHEKEKIYIPEMIFGHLLTGSNYDDNEAKVTGGRNGYGAKLCNVFSTEFTLETVDSKTKQKYKQTWRKNMSVMEPAKISSVKGEDWTKVTFRPDFVKFGMQSIDDDFEALVKRRVYDMAGTCSGVKVYLNDDRIKVNKFKSYMEMYTKAIKTESLTSLDPANTMTQVILTDKPDERWEIGFAVSDGSFQQVSFVNSIATTQGGTHVNYIADQIVTKLAEIVKKKKDKAGALLKNAQIKNHMFLFVNCLIVNPAFNSQTKEQLTTKASQFGSKCTVSEKFLKDIAKTEIIANILEFAQKKADQMLKKSDGNRRSRMDNAKLTDANKAGTRDGHKCTLILTEGDSASLLALAGRAVLNPDEIGVFPLRGKLLNVRDASIDAITKNQEIQNIKKFMGLQHKKVYSDTTSLRYGHLMIMTDQDHDGSHIKGLLINFLQCQFPSLLKIPGFLREFITPIVKVWKGDPKRPRAKQDFFTMPEYEAWKLMPGNASGWEHKYYKGLGTSSPSDAEVYFADLDKHRKSFATLQEHENQLIDLAFSKKKADERKLWLQNFVPGTFLDMSSSQAITYDDFINKELILFSMADNQRSIPSVIDGFKPGQRKVLYTCFRRDLKKDVKVVELAGSVSGLTAYAYGDTSLQQTIVGLAQNFVGSNNINTLEPSGNYGSRLQGGSDAASARYIYTRLSPFARRVFHSADEALLTYNTDDGKTIEPETYVPILPMILVNGADGIGTGWSTSIPNYNPMDIIENLRLRMQGSSKEDMKTLIPWFRGWQGETESIGDGKYRFNGTMHVNEDKNEVEIVELPIRVWTQDYKDKLETIIRAEKSPSPIKDYSENNTPEKVHFVLKMVEKDFARLSATPGGFDELFKLTKQMSTTNLVAFDGQGRIHKYESPLDIMEEFYHIRLDFYSKRKVYLLAEMTRELDRLTNQARFVQMIIDDQLVVSRKKKVVLVTELQKLGFKRFPKIADAKKQGEFEESVQDENADDDESEESSSVRAGDYDYLLGMAIWSLTQERVEKLKERIGDKEVEIDVLTKKRPKDLWCEDLDALAEVWEAQLEEDAQRAKKTISRKRRLSGKPVKGKKRKAGESDDDSEFDQAPKKKQIKTAATAKPAVSKTQSSMESWMANKDTKPPGVYKGLLNIDGSPIARPPAERRGLIKPEPGQTSATNALKNLMASTSEPSKLSDSDKSTEDSLEVKSEVAKPQQAIKGRTATTKTKKYVESSDAAMSDDEFHDIDEVKEESAPSAARQDRELITLASTKSRTAAQKPRKYAISDDESEFGDKDLGDLSAMVKGSNTTSSGKQLLTSTTLQRPSSATHALKQQISMTSFKKPSNNDIDDTDWTKLAEGSPRKAEANKDMDVVMMDDEDESLLMSSPRKQKPIMKTTSSSTAAKKADSFQTKQSKTTTTAPKTKQSVTAALMEPKKPQSPMAKAYAKNREKQASNIASTSASVSNPKKPAPSKSKKQLSSDDEDDLVNEILDDDDSDSEIVTAKAVKGARPARRTAATKSKFVIEDEDEDESMMTQDQEASETDFDDDESD